MWIATIVGKVDDDLAAIESGPPSVSGWNTLWSRVLRVYIATAQPSNQLQRIANIIVKFSVAMWFQIKRHSYMTDGPHNTFVCLQLLKHLNDTEIHIVKKVVQRNCFFAHPDQLLLAMCTDRNEAVRRVAVNKMRKLRDQYITITEYEAFPKVEEDDERPHIDEDFLIPTDDEAEEDTEAIEKTHDMPSKNIRKVIIPKLKFHATNYHHMIDWDTELKTEPSFLTSFSDEGVLGILKKPLSVPKWPNHTQSIERGIQVMTEACTEVAGYKARDGYIRQRLSSRRIMPTFRTKKHFSFNY